MAKHKQRSKAELIQEQRNGVANKIVEDNQELAAEIKVWLQDKKAKLEELEQLKLIVDEYGEAKAIIDEKEQIIKGAKEEKEKLEAEVSDLATKRDELSADVKRVEEMVGEYSEAETIVDAAKKKADEIVDNAGKQSEEEIEAANKLADEIKKDAEKARKDAEKELKAASEEAKTIVEKAEEEAQGKIQQAEIEYKAAVEEKDTLLKQATESAKLIRAEAEAKVKELISGYKAAGESEKASILSAAQIESGRIKDVAQSDAEMLSENIKKQADDYAQRTREQAEKEAEDIINRANKNAEGIYAKAESVRSKADEYYNAKLEKGDAELLALREKLDADIEKCSRQIQQNEDVARRNKDKKAALEQREQDLNEEVLVLLEEKCTEKDLAVARAQEVAKKYKKLYEGLEKIRQYVQDEKNKDFPKQVEELSKLKKHFKTLESFGITPENVGDYISAKTRLDEMVEENKQLKKDLVEQRDVARRHLDQNEELKDANDKMQRYREQIEALKDQIDSQKTVSREEMIRPITLMPSDWETTPLKDDREFETDDGEKLWIDNIVKKANECGIVFSERLVNAYHTAQKINDMSSLVVLAGVSGTGKSELPKQYAIHGGMNFIDIPVKPDWDSPSSLFGYYNSIERRFEATELIRALYQMNQENSPYKDQMLMVLLDEMNLAHPEQYFADLLSKLETCRNTGKNAVYDAILGGGAKPLPINIGTNVLWTGTMNEDETTKALSDKVIDRSTLITFPRPEILFDRKDKKDIKPVKQEFVLKKSTWDTWCGNRRNGLEEKLAPYKAEVQEINKQMSGMGRNLGHRVWQGISEYICNYPAVVSAKNGTDLDEAIRIAYNDALAFKIMPKLRGVETRGENERYLDEIGKTLTNHAGELSVDFTRARNLPTELFQWYSSDFMNVKEG